jgi:hypothetical protein
VPYHSIIKDGARNYGKELNVIVYQLAHITLTSIAERHPGDITLTVSSKKDRTLEMKRQKYKELMQTNTTFCEIVNLQQDLSILKVFQDNVDGRNITGKLQTCFSFNKVIFAIQYRYTLL